MSLEGANFNFVMLKKDCYIDVCVNAYRSFSRNVYKNFWIQF